jgi:hypothetical protein
MEAAALHHDAVRVEVAGMPPRGGRGGGANSNLSDRAQNIGDEAIRQPDLKSALRVVERANLPRRDRAEVVQYVTSQYKSDPVQHNPDAAEFASESQRLSGNQDFKGLSLVTQSTVSGLVRKHGIQDTVSALTAIAHGAKSPKMTQDQAQAALDVLNGQ